MQNHTVKFSELIRKSKEPQSYRLFLVKHALVHVVSNAARYFNTTRKTVQLWLKRYLNSPNKMDSAAEIRLREELDLVQKNIKLLIIPQVQFRLNLPYSLTTIRKKSRKWGYSKSFTKKRDRKRNLTEIKANYKLFEKIQVDIKYLDDIPEFYNDSKGCNLPPYQITARCIKTGALYFSYGYDKTVTNTTIFQIQKRNFSANYENGKS